MNKLHTGKRLFDIFFSLGILVSFAIPVFLPIVIILKLSSGSPVFFVQKRQGLNGNEFLCYKFSTMHGNKERQDILPDYDESRITRFGAFLRYSGLDELPQFYNVLKGDMSVVGPRPMMVYQNMLMKNHVAGFELREKVRPGITGLAQVSGLRGPVNSLQFMQERINADNYYINHLSIKLDTKIILKTFLPFIKIKEFKGID